MYQLKLFLPTAASAYEVWVAPGADVLRIIKGLFEEHDDCQRIEVVAGGEVLFEVGADRPAFASARW